MTATLDRDGRLHVEMANISKAGVCPYRGKEIPGWQQLGLDPNRTYQLLRDPDELRKAAPTFNGLPLLSGHASTTADSIDRTLICGTIGSDASFDDPYLTNSLHMWTRSAIESGKKGLSAAYHYKPDMTPGKYQGVRFDGVMRGIVGNHVALCGKSRAGADVVIGDNAIARRRGVAHLHL
jgi:uncharacterized protein